METQQLFIYHFFTIAMLLPYVISAQVSPGIFENSTDVGPVLHAGSTTYDAFSQRYRLSGSGENGKWNTLYLTWRGRSKYISLLN